MAEERARQFAENIIECPRCGNDALRTCMVGGCCEECQLAEEEADWMDEDEEEGGSPWGR